MARFGNVNVDEFTSAQQNEKSKQTTKYAINSLSVVLFSVQYEMWCTKHIIIFFLRKNFPIVLYGEV